MNNKTIKQCVALGIIGCGIYGMRDGIPCHWIANGFNQIKTISGTRRLRELRDEFINDMTKDWKEFESIEKPLIAYNYDNSDKLYYINKHFLKWLKKKYGKKNKDVVYL